jgi:hypothetical protein
MSPMKENEANELAAAKTRAAEARNMAYPSKNEAIRI